MEAEPQPATLQEFIEALHESLVCARCGRYVGSLGARRYLPPPYPVALDRVQDDDVRALVGFEWHMRDRLRRGNFMIRHPEVDGRCVTYREWLDSGDDEPDGDDENN